MVEMAVLLFSSLGVGGAKKTWTEILNFYSSKYQAVGGVPLVSYERSTSVPQEMEPRG